MKILHTSDVLLDGCYAGLGMPVALGTRCRQSLREVFRSIIRRARDWPADALLIAGNLFRLDRVSKETVAFLQSEFASIEDVPVVIAPGNQDPWVPSSPYVAADWPENVVIFSAPAWTTHLVEGSSLAVHGFAFDGPAISSNPFGSLAIDDDGRTHVAVAHGAEESCVADGLKCARFQASDTAVDGLAYLALGHSHEMRPVESGPATVMYYSGAPEGHGFHEAGPHHYLEVKTSSGGVSVTPAASSRIVYAGHSVDCSGLAHPGQVTEQIRALAAQIETPQIARVTLTGNALPEWRTELKRIYEETSLAFEFLDLVDATESDEDYETLASEDTSLGAFMARLGEGIRDTPDETNRRMLVRARELGLAAYRGHDLPVIGSGGD